MVACRADRGARAAKGMPSIPYTYKRPIPYKLAGDRLLGVTVVELLYFLAGTVYRERVDRRCRRSTRSTIVVVSVDD